MYVVHTIKYICNDLISKFIFDACLFRFLTSRMNLKLNCCNAQGYGYCVHDLFNDGDAHTPGHKICTSLQNSPRAYVLGNTLCD